jgi:hypothetical protein
MIYIFKNSKEKAMRVKIFMFLFLIILPFLLFSQDTNPALEQADDLFEQMSDMETAQRALDLYRTALDKKKTNMSPFGKSQGCSIILGNTLRVKKKKRLFFLKLFTTLKRPFN